MAKNRIVAGAEQVGSAMHAIGAAHGRALREAFLLGVLGVVVASPLGAVAAVWGLVVGAMIGYVHGTDLGRPRGRQNPNQVGPIDYRAQQEEARSQERVTLEEYALLQSRLQQGGPRADYTRQSGQSGGPSL